MKDSIKRNKKVLNKRNMNEPKDQTIETNLIEHISTPVLKERTVKDMVFEELDKGNIGLWYSLPPVEIYPGLWLGNVFNAQDLHFRFHKNIKTIINCATHEAQPQLLNIQTYICLNGSDEPEYKILDNHFNYVYDIIDMSLEKGINVLIHCQCGVNRSSTLAIAYICMKTQCSIEKAILDVYTLRPCILTNRGFRNQLFEWSNNLYWMHEKQFQSVSLIEIHSDNETLETTKDGPKQYNLIVSKPEVV